MANLHGDVVTTITLPTTQAETTPATTITGWSDYTEFGTPRNPWATIAIGGPTGYGWLGAKQRATSLETAGLTLMGDRYYNPIRGLFTALDPEPGGNPNAYTYPLDPIGMYDLDGHKGRGDEQLPGESRRNWIGRHGATVWACSQLGKMGCALAATITALASAMTSGIKGDYASNAVRHFVWQTTLYFFFGMSKAKLIGDAHESGLSRSSSAYIRNDSQRDQRNNGISRTWAKWNMSTMSRAYNYGGLRGLMLQQVSIGLAMARRGQFANL